MMGAKYLTRREFKIHLGYLREIRVVKEMAQKLALDLQAVENARRLDVLNHAHEDAVKAAAMTVPRETFDNKIGEIDKWRTEVRDTLSNFNGGLTLLRFVGFAGLLAFLLQLLHLSGVTK